ncbi:hypothetical protein [Dipodfec virus UOA04_Rod_582]|nr:hypothetical protein [Dipodfec virus UOA04_Rod_582]
MLSQLTKKARKTRAYNTDVVHVQGNLALTPSDMIRSARLGTPISSQSLSAEMFDDGELGPARQVPFLLQRGIDVGDVASYQEQCRSKVRNYLKSTPS